MAKSESPKNSVKKKHGLERGTVMGILSIITAMFGFLLAFSFPIFRLGGVEAGIFEEAYYLFGFLAYFLPLALFTASYFIWKETLPPIGFSQSLGLIIFLLAASAIPNTLSTDLPGGLLGTTLAQPFLFLFTIYPALLFLWGTVLISILMVFDEKPDLSSLSESVRSIPERFVNLRSLFRRQSPSLEDDFTSAETAEEPREDKTKLHEELMGATKAGTLPKKEDKGLLDELPALHIEKKTRIIHEEFAPLPITLFEKDRGKPSVGDIKANAAIIKRTLQNFGINVEMDEISVGPSVTRYSLKPAQGVKLSRIVSLQNELALDLAVESIRVEAPIPGKSLVGIEIPNETKSTLGLGSLFSEEDFAGSHLPLLLALGRGISGKPTYANLAKMPHLLIAGTTGSGKSVMVHSIINSLLFRNSPYDLKFILVDPKKVELTFYNKIPHLYTPVITNAKKTIQTLNWAVREMERRYDVLEESGEKDVNAYHHKIYAPAYERAKKLKDADIELPERMPYIVIIIDELADIMMTYPKELEGAIVRLAQKSRAVGIHLILSTQRPEVKVITGLIKANIPSRVALKVASQIDSRTIIDMAGAEKLLGQGDMLFISSENPRQERIQGPFVSTEEIKKVVKFLTGHYDDMAPDEIIFPNADSGNGNGGGGRNSLFSDDLGGEADAEDELYGEAKEIVESSGKASTSYLQRRLKIGYSRAARLIDMLEERGIVGAGSGAKPREILTRNEPAQTEATAEESI